MDGSDGQGMAKKKVGSFQEATKEKWKNKTLLSMEWGDSAKIHLQKAIIHWK